MPEIVEKRVKKTVIRRRAKTEDPAPPPEPQVEEAAQTEAGQTQAAPTGVLTGDQKISTQEDTIPKTAEEKKAEEAKKEEAKPEIKKPVIIPKAFEDKFKKAVKKKLTKAEMEFEDIKRAGGLKHVVLAEMTESSFGAGERQRVFRPTPRKRKPDRKTFKKTQVTETKASKRVLKIEETISVAQMSKIMGIKVAEIIKKLMALGVMATVNQNIDVETATLVAQDFEWEVEHVAFKEQKVIEDAGKKRDKKSANRAPVVTVMGHVDHGKTSILDYIRKASVASGEAGGITQHIGAYVVTTPKGKITFIDTPGHAAFTAMRARGAQVTDIAIIVVAADDGVMPQTKEAIDHSRAANVPMIIAINKVDKPDANIEKTKRSLSEYNIIPEDWGGDAICVNTSAKSGDGIDHLLEMILLQAEMMELKADPGAAMHGTVVESELSKGRGPLATVLVKEGTIKVGMSVICGLHYGKIRALYNYKGDPIESAGPSEPVEVVGLSGVPGAADEIQEVSNDKLARMVSETRTDRNRQSELGKLARVSLEDLHKQVESGDVQELSIVLKTDVHGSVEAVKDALINIPSEKVKVKVVHASVGGVTESDVMLASATNAIVIGFNVVPGQGVTEIAEREKIEIRRYSIIYELVDDIRNALEGLLAPLHVEKIIGHAEVRQVFSISKVGTIAGSIVKDGRIVRTAKVRLVRDSVVITDAKLSSLKRFKDDAKEVKEGLECGIALEKYNDIKVGDVFEAYIIEEVAQKL